MKTEFLGEDLYLQLFKNRPSVDYANSVEPDRRCANNRIEMCFGLCLAAEGQECDEDQ